jgi:hypothetical protein
MWPAIIEKMYSKINGNYESIEGGWPTEVYELLLGCPSEDFTFGDTGSLGYDTAATFSIIKESLANGYVIGAAIIGEDNTYNLPGDHAYSVIGAFEIRGLDGEVEANLIQLRNPWGEDDYTGPWNQDDDYWTSSVSYQLD